MSKKVLRPIAAVAAIGAMFVPGVAFVAFGAKIGLGMLLSVGIGVGSSLLLKHKRRQPQLNHSNERLHASLEPHAPRKIPFGYTAMATDVRYQAYTGANQEYLEQILCTASITVESQDEVWFDSKKAWSAAGGVTAEFAGYLTVTPINPGTAANGIAIDGVWTSSCTLTGCAYLHLKYKLTGNSKKAESPFASGVPSRVTVRGKGAKVYDPRFDSTVAGGSGTQRADDQTTWAWSSGGSEGGRNPALQRLFYLLGWKINGKLAVGRGIPPARLDMASFIEAANICDETVALAAGGSEKRYRSDCVVSEGDEPAAVLGALNAAMNAVPTDDGGKLGVLVLRNDLADPDIIDLSEDDLADPAEESWRPTASIEELINVVRGRFTDPSDAGLYQMIDAPEVTLPGPDLGSPDGIQRIAPPFDLPAVQSGTQWQRLAHLKLNRTKFPGIYSANFKARAWATRMWKPVRFTHPALRFSSKLFRVVGQELPIAGVVRLTLREESADIYTPAAEKAVTVPASPPPWNPANDPLVGGIGDAGETAVWPSISDRPPVLTDLAPTGRLKATNMQYGDAIPVEDLKPSELGAEKTTGKSLTLLIDRLAGNISYNGGASVESLKPAEAGAEATAGKSIDVLADGATYARIRGSELSGGEHKLGIPGSGKRIGDQRNLHPITALNLSYKWTGTISYTADSSGNATISVGAATIPIGSVSVSYNAMTVSVTGTAGTTVTYQLYLDDPNLAGGSQTLVAVTDGTVVYQDNGRVWVGTCTVTFPSSGSTSGGGSTGGGGGGGHEP
ncbi:MAG: hypothetical protein M3N07_03455 [Pseudomonadota bacterium]|nr:hypothetical protein [Pseudomonadota bacterium]